MIGMVQLSMPISVRALTDDDVGGCDWAGTSTHLAYVRQALTRAARGEVEYLAVCPPSGLPVAIGGVDFVAKPGVGTLWQLVVHPALRSCGLGTVLVQACEDVIRGKGIVRAELAVEYDNPRAHTLYRRLGYLDCGHGVEEWDVESSDGALIRYRTACVVMGKQLPSV